MRRLSRLTPVVAALLAACARAPEPPLAPSALPFTVDTLRTRALRDGVRHHFIYSRSGPWAIQVLDVRLDRCYSAISVKGAPGAIGRATVSELLRTLVTLRDVVGGVNADFFLFTPPGVPTGAHVSGGRVVTPPVNRPVFAIDSAGLPHIVTLSVRGGGTFTVDDTALAHASLLPFHPIEAVGGRPVIARDSVISGDVDTFSQAGGANMRHPRTAVGIATGGRRLLLVAVDGRQAPYSDGMTLRELATLMLALGAREALNLDGGGSTALVVAERDSARGLRVANHPSDAAGERPVGNALAIVQGCRAR